MITRMIFQSHDISYSMLILFISIMLTKRVYIYTLIFSSRRLSQVYTSAKHFCNVVYTNCVMYSEDQGFSSVADFTNMV